MDRSINRLKLFRAVEYSAVLVFVMMPFTAFLTSWAGNNFGHLDLFRSWKEILLALEFPALIWIGLKTTGFKEWIFGSLLGRLIVGYSVIQVVATLHGLLINNINVESALYGFGSDIRYLYFMLMCLLVARHSGFIKTHLIKIIFWPAGLVLVVGFVQRFIDKSLLTYFYGDNTIPAFQTIIKNTDTYRVQSTLRGPNPFGAYLSMIIPMVILVKDRLWKTLISVAAIFALYLSFSRSAWLGAVVGLLMLFFISRKKIDTKKTFAVLVVVSLFMGAVVYHQSNNQTFQKLLLHTGKAANGSEAPDSKRLDVYKQSVKVIKKNPLGYGDGYAGPASMRNTLKPSQINENYYLQIAEESGVIGLGAFLTINFLMFMMLYRNREQKLSLVLAVTMIGISLINLVSHGWSDDTLAYLWWGLAGVALSPVILKTKHEHKKTIAN